ncbi:MAG: phospho-N-acetylmuramoyl-pentapeptide-transferase, partial [Flavobacteriaceae bacterium]|nr:phospho-N-acetylmuramoyl-pentapeptide-transferase [Flavobacteriaceae bacterium]
MLYYLFEYLEKEFQFPGASLFGYITFRAALAIILSLLISTIYGKRIINYLRKKQVGETIRDLGLEGQQEKAGTPTMGGALILVAIAISTLLWADLENRYVWVVLLVTLGHGVVGFVDDYRKVM